MSTGALTICSASCGDVASRPGAAAPGLEATSPHEAEQIVSAPVDIDGVLVQWGDRLFYPSNRIVRPVAPARLTPALRHKAAGIRGRIKATVRRAPQVMVKVTGGGRGTRAIGAHISYIDRD